MDRREPLADGVTPASETRSRSFSRLARGSTPRRLSPLALAALIGGILGIWVVIQAGRSVVSWLHAQPAYAIAFEAIELQPEPPKALKGGVAALLAQVRERSRFPDPIRVLDHDPKALADAFRLHSPWVARVDSVRRPSPGRLVVHLVYREPVAKIEMVGDPVAIDAQSWVLPLDQVADDVAKFLPRLSFGNAEILARTGRPLEIHTSSKSSQAGEKLAKSAANMANFLRKHSIAELRITRIDLKYGDTQILLMTSDDRWILWGEPPDNESIGQFSATEKLRRLREWCKHPGEHPREGSYIRFHGVGVQLVKP